MTNTTVLNEDIDIVGLIDNLQRSALEGKDDRQPCENSRNVFWGALAVTTISPRIWTADLVQHLDGAFETAVATTTAHYQFNILDRWIDLKVLRERGFFGSLRAARLLYLHVLLRGYRREIQRVSYDPNDKDMGRESLTLYGRVTTKVFSSLRDQSFDSLHPSPDVKVLADKITKQLHYLVDLTTEPKLPEHALVARSIKSCEAIEETFQELGIHLDAPSDPPPAAVNWWDELATASTTCARFGSPKRPEIAEGRSLITSILDSSLRIPLPHDEIYGKLVPPLERQGKKPVLEESKISKDTNDQDAAEFQLLMDRSSRSYEAFRRDLPQLLQNHKGEFAAYKGDALLGVDRSLFALEARLSPQTRDDYDVQYIEPQDLEVGLLFW